MRKVSKALCGAIIWQKDSPESDLFNEIPLGPVRGDYSIFPYYRCRVAI